MITGYLVNRIIKLSYVIAKDDRTVLFAVKLHSNHVVIEYMGGSGRKSAVFTDERLSIQAYHTLILSVTRTEAHLNLDCDQADIMR